MTYRTSVLLAAGGSAALLIGALAFQYLGGLPPCKLCYWQRYPHVAAVLIGALALWLGGRTLAWMGALAALATAGVGLYHTGVERGWWEGPTSCTGAGGGLGGLSGADLLSTEGTADVVMCDEVAWQMFGLSMASWNMLASLVLVAIWVAATRRAAR